MITTFADIFSIGAVLSHTVAWVVGGRQEQKNYFTARKTHHDTTLRRFKNSGYEGCFHDSIEPLRVVAEQHKRYLERLQPSDDVTPQVLKWIEQCMLVRAPQDRLRARDILERFEQFIDSRPPLQVVVSLHGDVTTAPSTSPSPRLQPSDSRSTIQPPPDDGSLSSSAHTGQANVLQGSTPDTPSCVSSNGLPDSNIGISQIHQFKSDTHQGKPADLATARLVEYLEHNLGGRDQFFFIDDSASMRTDRVTIADGFRALACIAKRLDPNQIELAFASRPQKIHRAKHTPPLHRLVQKCQYKGEGHLMESRLSELIDEKIIPRLPYKVLGVNLNFRARKKVSLYVFTDGDWGDEANSGDACGVERPVKRLIEELKKRNLDRTQVSLHFVRFGNKENGRKHLERLDEFGRKDGW